MKMRFDAKYGSKKLTFLETGGISVGHMFNNEGMPAESEMMGDPKIQLSVDNFDRYFVH